MQDLTGVMGVAFHAFLSQSKKKKTTQCVYPVYCYYSVFAVPRKVISPNHLFCLVF